MVVQHNMQAANANVYCSSESGKISVRTTYFYGL